MQPTVLAQPISEERERNESTRFFVYFRVEPATGRKEGDRECVCVRKEREKESDRKEKGREKIMRIRIPVHTLPAW